MKNKIYEAFDSIKLDANIKKEALDNITKVKKKVNINILIIED